MSPKRSTSSPKEGTDNERRPRARTRRARGVCALEAWDAIAAGYAEHVAPGEQSLSAAALGLVGLTPGEKFLDVAAGPGGLGLAAARLVPR